MYWKYRVDLRDVILPLNKLSEKEIEKRLPQIVEEIAEKLEYSSVFRKSAFPKKLRMNVSNPNDLQSVLEEIYEFAEEEKVWLGLE